MKKRFTLLLSFILLVSTMSIDVFADDNNIELYNIVNETWGTSPIEFDDIDGVLTIYSGTLGWDYYWGDSIVAASDKLFKTSSIKRSQIKKLIFKDDVVLPFNSMNLFSHMRNLEEVEGTIDTSNVTDMDNLFRFANKLKKIDVSGWDTSNVRGMSYMFGQNFVLEELDVSNWDVGNVTNMSGVFSAMLSIKKNRRK